MVRVRLFSAYSLSKIKITGPLLNLKVAEKKKAPEETLVLPQIPLEISTAQKKLLLKVNQKSKLFQTLWVSPPRGSLMTLEVSDGVKMQVGGSVQISSHKSEMEVIEELPIEDYVLEILQETTPTGFPLEALKAQAVLIRTHALGHFHQHEKEGYQFCDTSHCQIYRGVKGNYFSFEKAVREVKSIFLSHEFKPIEVFYHSTCGGHTSAYDRVFGGKPIPYLSGIDDGAYCERSPDFKWENFLSLKILIEILKKDYSRTLLKHVEGLFPVDYEEKGRLFELSFNEKKTFQLQTEDFRQHVNRALGTELIPSSWFEVELKEGQLNFKGRGKGHGVGFCQWGARGRAEAGENFEQILFHYFPGTRLIER